MTLRDDSRATFGMRSYPVGRLGNLSYNKGYGGTDYSSPWIKPIELRAVYRRVCLLMYARSVLRWRIHGKAKQC